MTSATRALTWLFRSMWCGIVVLVGPVAAQPIPVADFFKPPAFSDMQMAPSGKRMSAVVPRADGRLSLAVLDLDDLTKSKIVAGYSDVDIRGVEWVNDDWLVFRMSDRDRPAATQRGSGLFAVSAAGGETPRMLIRPQWNMIRQATHIVSRALAPNHALESVLRDGSNDVVVAEHVLGNTGDLLSINLKRVDVTTGLTRSLSQGAPAGAVDWTIDRAGQPRVVIADQGDTESVYWKPTAGAAWVKIGESERYSGGGRFTPIFVDSGNRLYAASRLKGSSDTSSLVTIDMAGNPDQVRELIATPGFDFGGNFVLNARGTVLGVKYLTDARATQWFDADLKKIQDQVDTLLPGTVNLLDCGDCDRRDHVLVTSYADRQPAVFRLFDSKAGTLASIAESRPWIKSGAMATRDMVRVETRDGLSMPVHITRPIGPKAPLPMVVLVHGGPWVRGGEWKWDADSQFLASRGYVVIEPEFRGSTGFGYKHFRSSWKQWGLAMQDDVADAALWAIKQGHADPKRVCIAGASYGGYATLMGLIRNPEIFRCGVDWVGVTDIDLMYSITWSDFGESYQRYGMPWLVGDRVKDAEQLAATSPIKQAARITQPLLLAYGGVDRRVPIEHGTQFRTAVQKTNKQVEWIEYPDEGHGWYLLANNVDFWTRVEKFLDKNLKNAP